MKHQFIHRVIYQDTDAEGVVYYANYLGYFERGRTELLRRMGISLKEYKNKRGIVFAVKRVECDYLFPAFHDDEIIITTEVETVKGARIIFKQTAMNKEKLLVSAMITACALDVKTMKPVRLPKELAANAK
jgi:acyl-CoA thioester hydrolase